MIDEQAGALFYVIYQWPAERRGQSRAALAAADITLAGDIIFVYIIGAVNHNGPSCRIVVKAFFTALQAERIAITAVISTIGNIKAEAAFIRSGFI